MSISRPLPKRPDRVSRPPARGSIERIKHGVALPSWSLLPGPLRAAAVLPRGPVGLGFAVNMVLCCGAWYALLMPDAVPMWLGRVGRRRRGECERCGYDRRGWPTFVVPRDRSHVRCPLSPASGAGCDRPDRCSLRSTDPPVPPSVPQTRLSGSETVLEPGCHLSKQRRLVE